MTVNERRVFKVRSKRLVMIGIILLQFLIVVGGVLKNDYQLKNSRDVIVRIKPIDPRSFIQGDYARIAYYFSSDASYQLSTLNLQGVRDFPRWTVYVALKPDKDVYVFHDVYLFKPTQLPSDYVVVRGKMGKGARLRFGIETFFVEEGLGRFVELNSRFAHLKVTDSGVAKVVDLLQELEVDLLPVH